VSDEFNLFDISIGFIEEDRAEFELYQNNPNPFNKQTSIAWYMPESSNTEIAIYDVEGRLVRSFEMYAEEGDNQILIDAEELGTSGVLYYKISTSFSSRMKRMLLID